MMKSLFLCWLIKVSLWSARKYSTRISEYPSIRLLRPWKLWRYLATTTPTSMSLPLPVCAHVTVMWSAGFQGQVHPVQVLGEVSVAWCTVLCDYVVVARGACGVVRLAFEKGTCKKFAVKIVSKKTFSVGVSIGLGAGTISEGFVLCVRVITVRHVTT